MTLAPPARPPAPPRVSARVRRRRALFGATVVTTVAAGLWTLAGSGSAHPAAPGHAGPAGSNAGAAAARPHPGSGHHAPARPASRSDPLLAPGSDPAVLPGPLLIADRSNDRLVEVDPHGRLVWQFPRPGDLAPGQTFAVPDDAFFTPDGRYVIATQEDDFVVTLIDVARHRIVWRYGQPGVAGSGPDRLWNPDDAIVLPNGDVLSADIKNCRIVVVPKGGHDVSRAFGAPGHCWHSPPYRFGSPNGAFPMADGGYLVTEINGDWVDALRLDGTVAWSTHPPGVRYPSDSNEVRPGVYLTVDYSTPGQVEEFDRQGRLLWRYAPTGRDALAQPSLAEPLPNGDVLFTDDANDRVVVVDPHTNRVVWQYGHRGVPGRGPGYLHRPDGADLAPPYSLLVRHRATMGLP